MHDNAAGGDRQSSDRPALLGGTPVRPQGPPELPLREDVRLALERCFADGSWRKYHGPNVGALCEEMRRRTGREFVFPCASGTFGVELALRAARVEPGDEVILAAYDFKGNIANVLALGATPVLIDVDAANFQMDPARLPEAVTGRTKAVVVSHLHGGVVDMDAVREAAGGAVVVEDACQMPGATVRGRPAGSGGDLGVFSFGGSKLLAAGRGGAVVTADPVLAQRIRLHTMRGNDLAPLSEMQAAVLLPQWETLDEDQHARAAAVGRLGRLLADSPLTPFAAAVAGSVPGYYKLGFRHDAAAAGLSRDRFAAAVRAEGVALDPGFRSLHRTHSRRRFRAVGPLTHADAADERILKLHHPVLLAGADALVEVATAVRKVLRHADELASRET